MSFNKIPTRRFRTVYPALIKYSMTLRAADVTSLISRVSFIILVEQDGLFVNQPEFPNAAVILILILLVYLVSVGCYEFWYLCS